MTEPRTSAAAAPEGDCHAEWRRPDAGRAPLDLAAVRARLAGTRGPQYWRGLEEVAETPEFEALLDREFPRFAAEWPRGVSRRSFLELAAASLGLAGLTACTRQPIERIVPYVRQPEQILPGRPLFFATAAKLGGYATGVLVESHEGRPTKIEGNPEHPASFGKSDAVTQAAVLGLYDPDRSQTVTHLGRISEWKACAAAMGRAMATQAAKEGAGLRIVTGAVTGPAEAAALERLLADLPRATWHRWDALGGDRQARGLEQALGRPAAVRYELSAADVVVAIDDDLVGSGPAAVRYARDLAARRRPRPDGPAPARLYVAEAMPSPTGTIADHRLAVRASALPALLAALAARLGIAGVAAPAGLEPRLERFVEAAARDLAAARGRSLVAVGETLPAPAHALAVAINGALGNAGATVVYSEPVAARPLEGPETIAALVQALRAGSVDLLIFSGVNPVYDAPPDLGLAEALAGSPALKVHHGLYADETAELCQWHVPAAHDLESWGDARAFDGTVTFQQPLIEPLYGGKTAPELWAALAGNPEAAGYDLLREHWQERLTEPTFDDAFRRALHDGLLPGSAAAPLDAAAASGAGRAAEFAAAAATAASPPAAAGSTLDLALRPDPALLDGRFANNGWLQELPRPVTKLTWDNALLLPPREAERLELANEELAEVAFDGATVTVPVWILPGVPEGGGVLHLGYGRTRAGRVGDGVGASAYPLQKRGARWNVAATVTRAEGRRQLACTQGHQAIRGWLEDESVEAERRHVVRAATFEEFRARPDFAAGYEHEGVDADASLMPGYDYSKGPAWAMTIDLSACTGCNACVLACQAENNIPVVGREQVLRGREMHWIRVDRYFQGGIDEPERIVNQPIPCMQCEQAPCELVCPVAATVHSSEGLNDMVYNRCVGTRYCSNNCPYKVRRFNFLLYQDFETEHLKLQRNPDVSVRSRGVMEKCTYCVQRINRARIAAEREGSRPIRDGEVVTACQQACPSDAIVFGDRNDAESRVAAAKRDPRNYALLAELGTRPRTTYLAMVRNPNPELAG
jgi:molybdopterin-containing oxidoreductase family iron-sulfur binding subunit